MAHLFLFGYKINKKGYLKKYKSIIFDKKRNKKVSNFKNRLYLINYARVYMRENLHISKKNINFARCFSGKLLNKDSKILIIGYFVKYSLQIGKIAVEGQKR